MRISIVDVLRQMTDIAPTQIITTGQGEPGLRCRLCPRLSDFLDQTRKTHPAWHNAPVGSFGDRNARLLIVGLAPGLKGANRTGRPFTGDYAGDLLYATLDKFAWTEGSYAGRPDDGLRLHGCVITNAVRCVPPGNKPNGEEIKTCRTFLRDRIEGLAQLQIILALGRVAHQSVVAALGVRQADAPFAHGRMAQVGRYQLIDSFHCSRYNTNTGRLTKDMFENVFDVIAKTLSQPAD